MRNKLLFLVCFLVPSFSWGGSLSDIKTAELPGGRFEVKLLFTENPPEPKGYTIEKPARIVLDFPDVVSTIKEHRIPLAFENSQSAMILTSEGRTRIILNLDQLTAYSTRRDGNAFVIEVGGKTASSSGASETVAATQKVELAAPEAPTKQSSVNVAVPRANKSFGSQQVSVTNIDFRRGQKGEGRLVLTLSDPHVNANLVSVGSGVKLSFVNASLPSELRRRLDVLDFATPVSLVSASQEGSNAVFNISASGDFDYMAYQSDNEYVVSVKPLTAQEKKDKKKDFEFTGEKLSFDFQDVEVRAVLSIIADVTNLNLVASDTVQGRITLRLENVPWDQALALVLKTKGLDKRQEGNVLMVAPAAEIAERERQEVATRKQLEELAPLRTEYLRVRYANAKDMFELFKGEKNNKGQNSANATAGLGGNRSTGSILSERGQAQVDERTNSIIVTDTAERIDALKKLVEQIDIPIRQVMIEARIVIANTDIKRELGIRWGGIGYGLQGGAGNSKLTEFAGSEAGLSSNPGTPYSALANGGKTDMVQDRIVDLGVEKAAASMAIGYTTNNMFLDLELSALENSGSAEVVAQPKVITSDKQMAVIKSGKEIPYQEASASGATTTSFKEAVLKLEVTPQITPDNNIIMDLAISKDQLAGVTATGVPTIDITRLQNKVLVPNGETIVLGGVFGLDSTRQDVKVPVLGDIPYLGRLFKHTLNSQTKTELLIFITPKIIADKLTN